MDSAGKQRCPFEDFGLPARFPETHQFWVEFDNSEFSVPSIRMFNDLKLSTSNV